MKTTIAILAAGAVLFGAPTANFILNPAEAAPRAGYALIMGVEMGKETNEFVLDQRLTLVDCFEMARNAQKSRQRVGKTIVTTFFFCERSR